MSKTSYGICRFNSGFMIVGVILVMLVSLILMAGVVSWLQNESRSSVRYKRSTTAFHLAETAVDRAIWYLKKSTDTWGNASAGIAQTGYNFDTAYDDIAGGVYRIKLSSGPLSKEVTIIGEGRDSSTREVRAIKAIYRNQTINGSIITGGVITWSNHFQAHWGPVLAHGNIVIDSDACQDYFPRKFSKQVVYCTNSGNARDANGLTPPNTDNTEWWSDYEVPDMPLLNFTALRESAKGTTTLNKYGCNYTTGSGKSKVYTYNASWAKSGSYYMCNVASPHTNHLLDTDMHPDSKKNYVWYWDGDVTFTGGTSPEGSGLYGTIIVRGNCTIATGDDYSFTGTVPVEAWKEYAKITKTKGDTTAKNEYPADDGYQKNRSTFNFGSETWTGGPPSYNTDVGYRGFIYVGGNLTLADNSDYFGAIWAVGNITKTYTGSERGLVFYDENLPDIPTLNVVLKKISWEEVSASSSTWP